ncbi:iron ABC transporter permease [Adlercreutzia sp. ZJ242]|uniref:FecCD family ABC transporter permease n=1 Tax=Adlercreutzia sp. ZJ242 TaxID=2709409 RepID=UPI0013ED9F99|nr:iron ABC transporter permease [Adlercreutzia sp. ZJ242]
MRMRDRRFWVKMGLLAAALVVVYLCSFVIGSVDASVPLVVDVLLSRLTGIEPYWSAVTDQIMLGVRFPQITLSVLIGGALAVSGASYQTVFKNPMVSSDILGVSAGAGFGAALAMLNGCTWWQIQLAAFVGGSVAVLLAYVIGAVLGRQNLTVLVLAGVVTSSFFQALISIVKTVADTDSVLPSITFWLMGSLNKGDNADLVLMLPAVVLSLALLFAFRNKIDVLAAGEDEARSMGVNVNVVKGIVIVASTLMTACAVSVAGIIGWIGMVVPHIARTITGASFSKLLGSSFLAGGIFLLLIDDIVRSSFSDLPLGVLTALIGTPMFVFLLIRTRKEWV